MDDSVNVEEVYQFDFDVNENFGNPFATPTAEAPKKKEQTVDQVSTNIIPPSTSVPNKTVNKLQISSKNS